MALIPLRTKGLSIAGGEPGRFRKDAKCYKLLPEGCVADGLTNRVARGSAPQSGGFRMSDPPIYHEGMRALQDRFGTKLLADRLAQYTRRTAFTEEDRAFIEGRTFFYLATADAEGFPDCSYKGGAPGWVFLTGPDSLAFPSLDGNGMYRSLGNILVNPRVGMMFMSFDPPRRLRVNGTARLDFDDPALERFPGADLIVHVSASSIFPNCPRYIHNAEALSPYLDHGQGAEVPGWKRRPEFAEALPVKKGVAR